MQYRQTRWRLLVACCWQVVDCLAVMLYFSVDQQCKLSEWWQWTRIDLTHCEGKYWMSTCSYLQDSFHGSLHYARDVADTTTTRIGLVQLMLPGPPKYQEEKWQPVANIRMCRQWAVFNVSCFSSVSGSEYSYKLVGVFITGITSDCKVLWTNNVW